MKFLYIVFFIIIVSSVSCRDNKANRPDKNDSSDSIISTSIPNIDIEDRKKTEWIFDSLTLEKRVYIDNNSSKEGMSINLFFKYPTSAPENINLSQIQNLFAQVLANKKNPSLSPKDAFENKVKEYENQALDYAKEWQDEDNEYINFSNFDLTIATSGEISSKYIATISTAESSYLGGAHGSFHIKYDNIDLLNGRIITENDFFRKGYKDEVAKLIQDEISIRNNSENEDDQIYLLVDLDTVEPNGNFYFSTEGMVYTYNQYEITPYVQGPVEITIPYNQIKPLVSDSYQFLIQSLTENTSNK